MEEKFKRVYLEGIKSDYKVSTYGRILNTRTGKFLMPRYHTGGYTQVSLYLDTVEFRFYIHRLVMLTFNPIDDLDLQVNHKDGIKSNNNINNLEWVNNSQNQIHAYNNGLKPSLVGENHHVALFKDSEIRDICDMMSNGKNNYEIREKYPLANGDILLSIRNGRNWTHISKDYTFPKVSNKPTGENNASATYTNEMVHLICKMIIDGKSNQEIREVLRIESKDYVNRIRNKKIRKDISCNYNF